MCSRLQQTTATYFRFLVKQVETGGGINQHGYEWYETGFFTRWTSPGEQTIFCFDIPQTLRDRLRTYFLSPSAPPKLLDVYSIHMIVIDEIIQLFDASVWSLRDIIRIIELVTPHCCLTERERRLTIKTRIDWPLRSRALSSHCFMTLHGTRSTRPKLLMLR